MPDRPVLRAVEAAARGALLLANVGATSFDGDPLPITPPADVLAILEALKIAREALEFYADAGTYFAVAMMGDPPCGPFMDEEEWSEDRDLGWKPGASGRRALEAMSELVDFTDPQELSRD